MARRIRWGILGTGSIAAQFAEAIRLVPDAELAAVGSRTIERAKEFAHTHGARRAVVGRDELARDQDVDVVYVATPNASHKADAIALLEGGRAVVCEKPFTTTAAEAREVVAAARRRGVFCMEAMWMHFAPVMRDLRSLVTTGEIGDVRMVVAQLGLAFAPGNRIFDRGPGGGVLLDLGVYPIAFAIHLLGRPTGVLARVVVGDEGVDEQACVVLDFAGGKQAVITTSARNRTANDATIQGTSGMIRVNEPLYCPESISITPASVIGADGGGNGAPGGALARLKEIPLAQEIRAAVRRAKTKTIKRRLLGKGYAHEIAEVVRCLQAGERECATMPLDETILVQETLDEVRRVWKHVPPPA